MADTGWCSRVDQKRSNQQAKHDAVVMGVLKYDMNVEANPPGSCPWSQITQITEKASVYFWDLVQHLGQGADSKVSTEEPPRHQGGADATRGHTTGRESGD